ncbi:MAG: peptidoglycan bridge formation glycyltransferase FemA/FemB family protein [Treponema sp.]|nr:peptidoglycan bridge formation glycyltransferase FemA/FemB family protein [Treponema sp.]
MTGIRPAELSACRNSASFLQSPLWGKFKSDFGWEAKAFTLSRASFGAETPLLVLLRRLAPGFGMAYVPWGPELPAGLPAEDAGRSLADLARSLVAFLPAGTCFIRFDPPWQSENLPGLLLPAPFRRASADIQAPDTVIVSLSPSEAELLAGMKPKWRYNVALAGKRGVTVSVGNPETDLGLFYGLLEKTARRDGIAVHGIGYYRRLFERAAGESGVTLRLYMARHEGDCLAGIVVLHRGSTATYLYGASADLKRNLMAPYALQWRAMRDAKAAGCAEYDLFGIPPDADPDHPMVGLYRFKTGFGGKIVHRPGSWDFPAKPLPYRAFRLAESLRKKLRDLRKRHRKTEG